MTNFQIAFWACFVVVLGVVIYFAGRLAFSSPERMDPGLLRLDSWAARIPHAAPLLGTFLTCFATLAMAFAVAIAPKMWEADAPAKAVPTVNAVSQDHLLRAQVALVESNRALAAATRVLAQQLEKTQRPENLPVPPAPQLP